MVASYAMSKETRLLNLICIIGSLAFLAMIVFVIVTTNELLSTDNLFIITVCLVLALAFAVNPLLYLQSENKLPIPFLKKSVDGAQDWGATRFPGQKVTAKTPPLLDAKGRAVPPDVRAIVNRFGAGTKDA
ncbi:MAG TPA: hypothetical protein VLA93_04135 [Pyrinomonadaceae bacterium]|nr:hypothetical protein [Pyrinomonadaceae bacterium]